MKGFPKVIDFLQRAMQSEALAQLQYRRHAAMVDNLGYAALAQHFAEHADTEAAHYKRFLDRLTFLDGVLAQKSAEEFKDGDTAFAFVSINLATELDAVALYREAVSACTAESDPISRRLFEEVLEAEEDHVNDWETELKRIKVGGPAELVRLMDAD